MANGGALPNDGTLCPFNPLLQFPETANPKDVVLHLFQAACRQPSVIMPLLVVNLQKDETSASQKVAIYHCLQAMLEHGLVVEPAVDFIGAASKQLRASPVDVPRELQVAASNTLVTFAHHHFNSIMMELQRHLKPFVQPDEFTLLTLGKIAASNVFNCIPFLGITLTTLQTVLRWIVDSRKRRAFCTALGQMCGAIRIYLRSWERSSYPRISVQQFSTYLFPLYAYLTHSWLSESDAQVRLAILKVLSSMLRILLPRTDFQAQIYDDISVFLMQYNYGIEAIHVTKILGQILEASLVNSNPIPRTYVEPLACMLIQQVCSREQKCSFPQKPNKENYAEISHIFLRLARLHPLELMTVFQTKLEESQENVCPVVLALLSKIVDAKLPEVWSKRLLCVKVVKTMLGHDSVKVRLAMLQAIRSFLATGYLEKVEGWPLNYISLQLAVSAHQLTHPNLSLVLGGLEEKVIERTSMEALRTAVVSGRGTSQVLWTRLLSYLMQPHYAGSATTLCNALRHLAEQRLRRVLHDPAHMDSVDLPTPQELMARLMALSISPLEEPGQGAAVLSLLNALRPEVYKDVAEHWWVEIPALVHYLEGLNKYTLELATWEHKLLEFLKKSLRRNQEVTWNLVLAQELAKQLNIYHSSSAEKVFLYKALGTALCAAGNTEGMMLKLLELLLHTDYMDEPQRKGVCQCLAYCAEEQLPAVLKVLSHFEEEILEVHESVCQQLGQGLPHTERSSLKSTFLQLYGSSIARTQQEQLLSLLAGEVVPRILHHFTLDGSETVKDAELVLNFTQCVSDICHSILGKRNISAFQLPQKRQLLEHLRDIIKAEPVDSLVSPIRQQAMVALQNLKHDLSFVLPLSKIPEVLSHEEKLELAEMCLNSVFPLPPIGSADIMSEGTVSSVIEELYSSTIASLAELLENLLEEKEDEQREGDNSEWFQQTFQLLGYWMVSEYAWERARALQLATYLLRAHCKSGNLFIPLSQLSRLLGVLGPFTYDTLSAIRQGACNCIRVLLSIQGPVAFQKLKGRAVAWQLHCIRRKLQNDNNSEIRTASLQLAKIVSLMLPAQEILTFMRTLLEQLRTVNIACDQGVLLWFEVAVKEEGLALRDKVCDIVAVVCSHLQHSEDTAQHLYLTQAICVLAQHSLRAVCAALMKQPLLHDRVRKELWTALVKHPNNCLPILKYLLNQTRAERSHDLSCSVQVLTALQEVILALEINPQLLPYLSELCYILLCHLSSNLDANMLTPPFSMLEGEKSLGKGSLDPRRLAVAVLQAVLSQTVPEITSQLDLENVWSFFLLPNSCFNGIALLARVMADARTSLLDELLYFLLPTLSSPRTATRDLSVVFCGEVTGHRLLSKPETCNLLLQELLTMSQDENAPMRSLALRGLGNIVDTSPWEAKKHWKALLATALHAISEANSSSEVTCESLRALTKMSVHLGRWHGDHFIQAIIKQAHGHLMHVDGAVRAAAFDLFGQLAKITSPKQTKAFAKEVASALSALLLHLRDPNPVVAKACQNAFVACAPFVSLQELTEDMNAEMLLLTDFSGTWHCHLLARVCRQLAKTDQVLLDTILGELPGYMQCPWERIRLAACKLAGILVEAAGKKHLRRLDLQPLQQVLHSLSCDPSMAVEAAAAEAIQIIQQKWPETQDSLTQERQRRSLFSGWFLCF